MGLDMHPGRGLDADDWEYRPGDPHPRWSYRGFGEFRARLATEEGLTLAAMEGHGGDIPWDEVTTPLEPLLRHSDCDGEMTPEDAATVAPRLAEVIGKWGAATGADDWRDYDIRAGRSLVRLLELCAAEGLQVLFR